MRKSLMALAAVGAIAAIPAVAFGGVGADLGIPPKQLLPMKIGTPTAALTTGGSVVQVVVPITATGSQGFSKPIQLDVCLGAVGCKEVNVSVKGNGAKKGTVNFPLTSTVQGPVKVSLQMTAQTQAFRTVLKTATVTAS